MDYYLGMDESVDYLTKTRDFTCSPVSGDYLTDNMGLTGSLSQSFPISN